jgi:hypothetical protein
VIQRLVGRIVLVAVVVLGLYYVWSHYTGAKTDFGCELSGVGMAHAESDQCPLGIEQAASDPIWSAARLATIAHDKVTTGLFYEVDGTEHRFTSGPDDLANRVDSFVRASGVVAMPAVGQHPAATHVEAKVAMTMREQNVGRGVLVINNPRGPCTGAYSCTQVIGVLLPAGSSLTVWWPGGRTMTFSGRS